MSNAAFRFGSHDHTGRATPPLLIASGNALEKAEDERWRRFRDHV
jgi:hypothetical protein